MIRKFVINNVINQEFNDEMDDTMKQYKGRNPLTVSRGNAEKLNNRDSSDEEDSSRRSKGN